jgi:hypothetical protein
VPNSVGTGPKRLELLERLLAFAPSANGHADDDVSCPERSAAAAVSIPFWRPTTTTAARLLIAFRGTHGNISIARPSIESDWPEWQELSDVDPGLILPALNGAARP